MKMYWGWRYNATHFTLALGGEWSASYPSQEKSPWYPLDGRLGGPHSWSARGGPEIFMCACEVHMKIGPLTRLRVHTSTCRNSFL